MRRYFKVIFRNTTRSILLLTILQRLLQKFRSQKIICKVSIFFCPSKLYKAFDKVHTNL